MTDSNTEEPKSDPNTVQEFLQSAVFVDERATLDPDIEMDPDVDELEPIEVPEATRDNELEVERQTPDLRLENVVNAKALVESFASYGIVCSPVRPSHPDICNNEKSAELIANVANNADITILDWSMYQDDGTLAKKAIRLIVDRDNSSSDHERLRLLVIYTMTPSDRHESLVSSITEILEGSYGDVEIENGTSSSFQKGPLRVEVVSKPQDEEHPDREAGEIPIADLAKHVTESFRKLVEGILPMTALTGLAVLRNESHRLISNFDSLLDPAYLSHRLSATNVEETERFLEFLLVDEIGSLFSEHEIGGRAFRSGSFSSVKKLLAEINIKAFNIEATGRTDDEIVTLLLDILRDPTTNADADHALTTVGKKDLKSRMRNAPKLLIADDDFRNQSTAALEIFSRNRSLKNIYPPTMTLGTIVKTKLGEEDIFLVSTQPKCDCVRLPRTPVFPFAPAKVAEQQNAHHIAVYQNGSPTFLKLALKPSDLQLIEFDRKKGAEGELVAEKDESGKYFFNGTTAGTRFEWVGELKEWQAQRIASEIGNNFSRIGVDEPDFSRLNLP